MAPPTKLRTIDTSGYRFGPNGTILLPDDAIGQTLAAHRKKLEANPRIRRALVGRLDTHHHRPKAPPLTPSLARSYAARLHGSPRRPVRGQPTATTGRVVQYSPPSRTRISLGSGPTMMPVQVSIRGERQHVAARMFENSSDLVAAIRSKDVSVGDYVAIRTREGGYLTYQVYRSRIDHRIHWHPVF